MTRSGLTRDGIVPHHSPITDGAGDPAAAIGGSPGGDFIKGGPGDDAIHAGAGDDVVLAKAGDDLVLAKAGFDFVLGMAGADTLYGGSGDDELFGGFSPSSNPPSGHSDGDDLILGGAGSDLIRGSSGDDTLRGGPGDDNLRGDAGNDVMDGGKGHDEVAYRFDDIGATAGVRFDASPIGTAATVSLSDGRGGVDTVSGFEEVVLTGTPFADTLTGSRYGDQIDPDGGNGDVAHGGGGDDLFLIDEGGANHFYGDGGDDEFSEVVSTGDPSGTSHIDGGRGVDKVDIDWSGLTTGATISLAAGVLRGATADGEHRLSGRGLEILNASGGSQADHFAGASGADTLAGYAGADTLLGGAGDDMLYGGAGNDVLTGGGGHDLYGLLAPDLFTAVVFDFSSLDVIGGHTTFADNEGGVDSLQGITGAAFFGSYEADQITGSAGGDYFDGFYGPDTFHGGAGDDLVANRLEGPGFPFDPALGHQVEVDPGGGLLDGGAGIDTLSYADFTHGVRVDLQHGRTLSVSIISQHITGFEHVVGGDGRDGFNGSGAAETLDGGGGDDWLAGRGGADDLTGGTGQDTLVGGRGADMLTGGSGADTFEFLSLKDSTPAHPDLITDLGPADRIDLQRIDANATQAGDQAFVIVSAFDDHAGELVKIYDAGTQRTAIEMDVDGDGKADMTISVTGDHSDFANFAL